MEVFDPAGAPRVPADFLDLVEAAELDSHLTPRFGFAEPGAFEIGDSLFGVEAQLFIEVVFLLLLTPP